MSTIKRSVSGRRRTVTLLLGLLVAAPLVAVAGPAHALPIDPPVRPCERPVPPPSCGSGNPTGTLTTVRREPPGIVVAGTATDPDATGTVTVAVTVDDVTVGTVPAAGPAGDFSDVVAARAGHTVCAVAVNRKKGEDTVLGCRTVDITVDPVGHIDEVRVVADGLRVRGWVLDPDTVDPVQVRLTVDGSLRQIPTAAKPRPNVAAAYPAHGELHGFDVLLQGSGRHTSVCAVGVNVGPGASGKMLDCARDARTVSVLNLNLRGVHEEWDSDDNTHTVHIPWRERYDRIAQWMSTFGTLPDVIPLQEVWAEKSWFPFLNADPQSYETLLVLINAIKARTGANYRIASLDARHVPQGVNQLYAGEAVLYNADRLRNTTALVNARAVTWSDESTTGVHMRISYPCGRTPAGCALLDADGRHWMSSYAGTDRSWQPGPQAVVFDLVAEPGRHIIVVNAHYPLRDPGPHPIDAAMRSLIDSVWAAWLPRPKLLPPIVAGDFNGDPMLPDFDTALTEDVDFVLSGNPASYPADLAPRSVVQAFPSRVPGRAHCGSEPTLVSDHCALFVQFLPGSGPAG